MSDKTTTTKRRRSTKLPLDDKRVQAVILQLASLGCSNAKIAKEIGIAEPTLYKALNEDPKFAERLKEVKKEQTVQKAMAIEKFKDRSWQVMRKALERCDERLDDQEIIEWHPDRILTNVLKVAERLDPALRERKEEHITVTEHLTESQKQWIRES